MSLEKLSVGQKLVVSFNDLPNCHAVVLDFDIAEMKKVVKKNKGTVSIEVLVEEEPDTFFVCTVEHTQIVKYGVMLKLETAADRRNKYLELQSQVYDISKIDFDDEGIIISNKPSDNLISYNSLVESGDYSWASTTINDIAAMDIGETLSIGIKRVS